MAAINFPDSPSNGDTHTVGGVTYTYNSTETKWKTTINSNEFLPLSGGTLSGNLTLGSNQLTAGGLTYPTSDGTTGQYLQTNGSGTLSFATVATPTVAFESYAVIADEKATNTDGGTATSGDWRTRDLNTELLDPDGIVSISSNQFTLGAGTYYVIASANAYRTDRHQARLRNITDSVTVASGTTEVSNNGTYNQSRSFVYARFTLTSSKAFEVQHRVQTTFSNTGFGAAVNIGTTEKYTVVEIFKEA